METRDILKFTVMIAGIGELYGKVISETLTDIYWQALKRFELHDVRWAFQSHINNPDCGQYFPKPADMVRVIEGSGETKALHAWTKVEKAIHVVGSYQSIAFDDPLIHAVLEDMGGWVKLCSITLNEMPFRATEFQKRYMGFVNKEPHRYPKYLWGRAELENVKQGYTPELPLLVGDAKKAVEVVKRGGGTSLFVHHSKSIKEIVEKFIQCRTNQNKDEA